MNKILIPVDFSERSDYAYNLAEHLAEKCNAKIDLISIVPGPQGMYYDEMGNIQEDEGVDLSPFESKQSEVRTKMNDWIKDKRRIGSTFVKIGNIEKDIQYYAEHNGIDLIVMGTEGSIDNSWFGGTHTQHISNHTSVPVLSLKCDRTDINLEKILLVSDFLESMPLDLSMLKDIQHSFQSKIVLLFVRTVGVKETNDDILMRMADFVKRNELIHVEYQIHEDKAVESGIGKFAAMENIDLIAMGTHQKTGFSKLFRTNISDDVINHMYHPILTFPIREKD